MIIPAYIPTLQDNSIHLPFVQPHSGQYQFNTLDSVCIQLLTLHSFAFIYISQYNTQRLHRRCVCSLAIVHFGLP